MILIGILSLVVVTLYDLASQTGLGVSDGNNSGFAKQKYADMARVELERAYMILKNEIKLKKKQGKHD